MKKSRLTVATIVAPIAFVSMASCVRTGAPPRDSAFDREGGGEGAKVNERRGAEMAKDEAEMDLVAKLFLTGPRGPRDVRDHTASYSWVSTGRVYWVLDRKQNRRLVVATLPDWQAPVCLSYAESTHAISAFLSSQFKGKFPGAGRVKEIARFLKDAKVAPAASVASPELLEREKFDGFASWLRGREKDRAVFVALCSGVQEYEIGNEWRIEFNVFNQLGGVNSVKASGTVLPFTVQRIEVAETRPPGEFSHPITGN